MTLDRWSEDSELDKCEMRFLQSQQNLECSRNKAKVSKKYNMLMYNRIAEKSPTQKNPKWNNLLIAS